jgi:hypothetical protein
MGAVGEDWRWGGREEIHCHQSTTKKKDFFSLFYARPSVLCIHLLCTSRITAAYHKAMALLFKPVKNT